MAKKKKVSKLNLVNLVAVFFAIIALVLFAFLPMVKTTIGEEGNQIVTAYKGLGMIFGGTVNSDITTTVTVFGSTNTTTAALELNDIAFNTMAFVSLLLVLLGIIATLATTFVKSFRGNKLFTLVAGLLLAIGGVLMFTVKESSLEVLNLSKVSEYCSLGLGAIAAGILSLVSGTLVAIYPIVKK